MHINSIISYTSLLDANELSPRRREVYNAICVLGRCTNKEIQNFLGIPINQITGRVKELRNLGFVREDGARICPKSKKLNAIWTSTQEVSNQIENTQTERTTSDDSTISYGRTPETLEAKLRNKLTPLYTLVGCVLLMDERPELKDLIMETAKRANECMPIIDELLVKIENK
jgi:DNA-binding Lrp family transcriptional regulator